jgi:hypothetical protein
MSNDLFPSGPWIGFYNYRPGDRHRMDLQLMFANGSMTGDGVDDVGRFLIGGRYDPSNKECYWTKNYVGAHDVFYRGFREGKGIWGTWEITNFAHGGFHIWPRRAGEDGQEASSAEAGEPVDAIASEALNPPCLTKGRIDLRHPVKVHCAEVMM